MDPAQYVAALDDDALISLHNRLDASAVEDPATVEAHHLAASELLRRGHDHGHDENDDWSYAVVVTDEAYVSSADELDIPEEMLKALGDSLDNGGKVTVLLTTNGYVLKAEPTVSDVHVDAIMGAYPIRRKKRRKDEVQVDKARDWSVDEFVTWGSPGGDARGRIEKIVKEGSLNVPDSSFTINAEEDDPAVLIRVYRLTAEGFRPTDRLVGHKASALRSIGAVSKADGYEVPAGVREAAQRALKWIADGMAGDGFTSVGRNRARQLADGGPVGRDTLVKMRAYFARHGAQRGGHAALEDGEPTPWRVAWDAWGGDAGRAWANRVLGDVQKAYDPEDELTEPELALYDSYESIAEEFGTFSMEDAHYMGEDDNPFQGEGLNCANCVFYDGGGGCEILTDQVEPMGLCKFWIIPASLRGDDEELLESMDEDDLQGFADYAREMDDMEKAGNPEALRDYWRGGGKGKISWGGGGDFTACVAAVGKYMTSEQAKGYCAIRHREVTGMWPGDKRNRARKAVDAISDPHTITVDPPSAATTFTLPDGAVYSFTLPDDMVKGSRSEAGRIAAYARWGNRGAGGGGGGGRIAADARWGGGGADDGLSVDLGDGRLGLAAPRRPGMGDHVPVSDEDFAALQEGSAGAHIIGRTKDGAPVFSAERQALHDQIVNDAVDGVPSQTDPTYHLMGGGPAAGKSSAIEAGTVNVPGKDKAVQVNADEVKGDLVAADKLQREDWASFTHEESSYIAKRIQSAAFERRQSVVLDGTGDSKPNSVITKIETARAAGYRVEGHYVTCPTQMAVDRAASRAARTGRAVPESVIRGTHAAVSRVVPEVASRFDSFTLVDTSGPSPVVVATSSRGEGITVKDQNAWESFVAKGNE